MNQNFNMRQFFNEIWILTSINFTKKSYNCEHCIALVRKNQKKCYECNYDLHWSNK